MKPPDDPLDELLSQWQVRGEVPPAFQREVWTRIATGHAEPSWMEKLAAAMFRPRGWLIAATASILVGAGIAWMENRPLQLNPHDAYVRSISPFASLHLASH